MFKIKVTEKTGAVLEYHSKNEIDPSNMGHGLPERWIPASEPHDPANVIERENRELSPAMAAVIDEDGKEVSPAIPAVTEEWVKLRADYTVEIEDISAQLEQDRINRESQEYLDSTDWMIIRELDAGIACPAEVRQARAEARARIVR